MPQSREPNFRMESSGDTVELVMYDDIGPSWAGMIGAKGIAQQLQAAGSKVKTIVARINSPGGSIVEAMGIYETLKKHPANVRVEIDGLAASAASWIAMAGDEIVIAEHGLVMIHDPMGVTMGSADDHLKTAEVLETMKTSIVGVYAARTGQPADVIAQWMTDEKWMDAAEAVSLGFADKQSANKGKPYNWNPDVHQFRNAPEQLRRPVEAQPTAEENFKARLKAAKARLDEFRAA